MKPNFHVAIAILVHRNQILVGWRHAQQHQGNKYEFPGGKVEAHETAVQACRREVLEEVGIELTTCFEFDFVQHEYEDVIVNLHFFISYIELEQAQKIAAPWKWYHRHELLDLNFPKANQQIIKKLSFPRFIRISEDIEQLNQLQEQQYLYWRHAEAVQPDVLLAQFSCENLSKLVINLNDWKKLNQSQQKQIGFIHLNSKQLAQLSHSDLVTGYRYLASCHNQIELEKAQQIGCHAVFLSPVLATPTHPEQTALGWNQFAQIAQNSHVAVYALGGMQAHDLQIARQHYAYGLAGMRFI